MPRYLHSLIYRTGHNILINISPHMQPIIETSDYLKRSFLSKVAFLLGIIMIDSYEIRTCSGISRHIYYFIVLYQALRVCGPLSFKLTALYYMTYLRFPCSSLALRILRLKMENKVLESSGNLSDNSYIFCFRSLAIGSPRSYFY